MLTAETLKGWIILGRCLIVECCLELLAVHISQHPCPWASWPVQKWGRDLPGDAGDQAGTLLKASARETAPCLDPYLYLSQEGSHSWQVLWLGASVIWGQAVPRILSDTRISFFRQSSG